MSEQLKSNFDTNKYRYACMTRGLRQCDIAKKLGISNTSLYRTIKHNGDFTRSQIMVLYDLFGSEVANDFLFN